MVAVYLIIAVGIGFGLGYMFSMMDRTKGFTQDNPGPCPLYPEPCGTEVRS